MLVKLLVVSDGKISGFHGVCRRVYLMTSGEGMPT